jgi:hypothetical protein
MAQVTKYGRDVHARPSGEGGDDFVRILTELAHDLERFDSMIDDQRRMVEPSPGRFGRGHDFVRESFRLEAAEMAMRTRKALDRLQRMAEPARSSLHPEPGRGLDTEQRTD